MALALPVDFLLEAGSNRESGDVSANTRFDRVIGGIVGTLIVQTKAANKESIQNAIGRAIVNNNALSLRLDHALNLRASSNAYTLHKHRALSQVYVSRRVDD